MKTRIFTLIIFLFTVPLYGKSFDIGVPYSNNHGWDTGINNFIIETDSNGKIVSVDCDEINFHRKIEYGDNEVYLMGLKKTEKIDMEDFSFTQNGTEITAETESQITCFKNGQVFVFNKNVSMQEKISYRLNGEFYEAIVNDNMYALPAKDYEPFMDPYIIPKSGLHTSDMSINKANYLALSNIYYLDCVLMPLIFSAEPIELTALEYSATSNLVEGKTKYCASNLSTVDGLPWASANGYGIGDVITIETPIDFFMGLEIYNGFQSKEKKYLYENNSRVRKIKVRYVEQNKEMVFTLKDIPEKQFLSLKALELCYGDTGTLEIEILEVYKGKKYKDLCIQAIIPKM